MAEELGTKDFNDDTVFSTIGLDSLHVMNLVRKINASFDNSDKVHIRVTQHVVYYNHIVNKLATAIITIAEQETGVKVQGVEAASQDHIQAMQALHAANTSGLPMSAQAPLQNHSRKRTVLLTGSTGSLGSYLLDKLPADTSVDRVYCFERVHHGGFSNLERQKQAMKDHGLSTEISDDRVTFLDVDLSLPYSGLARSIYVDLLRTVTHILHGKSISNFLWNCSFQRTSTEFVSSSISRHIINTGHLSFLYRR